MTSPWTPDKANRPRCTNRRWSWWGWSKCWACCSPCSRGCGWACWERRWRCSTSWCRTSNQPCYVNVIKLSYYSISDGRAKQALSARHWQASSTSYIYKISGNLSTNIRKERKGLPKKETSLICHNDGDRSLCEICTLKRSPRPIKFGICNHFFLR